MLILPLAGLPLMIAGLVLGMKTCQSPKNESSAGRGWAAATIALSGSGLVVLTMYFVVKMQ